LSKLKSGDASTYIAAIGAFEIANNTNNANENDFIVFIKITSKKIFKLKIVLNKAHYLFFKQKRVDALS
jgi:hypothetical protein